MLKHPAKVGIIYYKIIFKIICNMRQLYLHIIFTISILSFANMAYAEEKIGIFTLNSKITVTEDILVTGFVNVDSSYKPVRLEVYDPNNELIYRPDVYFNDNGEFSWLFHPPLGKFDTTGTYTIIASHEDLSESSELQFIVNEKSKVNPLLKNISESQIKSESNESSEPIKIIESKNKQKESDNNYSQSENETKIIADLPIIVMILISVSIVSIIGIAVWIKQIHKRSLTT